MDSLEMNDTSRNEWHRNWRLVAAGSVCMFVTTIPPAVVGVFIKPLEREFGWSRTSITSAAAMTMIVAAFLSPFVSTALQRYGACWIGLIGMALTSLLFAAVALTTNHLGVYLGIWLFISCAIAFGGGQPWTTAVSRAFTYDRGLALGFTIAGGSIAAAVSPLIAANLMIEYGWRNAIAIMGLSAFAIFLPTTVFLIRGKSSVRDQAFDANTATIASESQSGITPQEALRSRAFWQLQSGLIFGCMIVNGMAVNLIPMLTSRALSTVQAASVVSALGVGAFVGKFIVGWLIDRIHPPRVVAATRLAGAAAAMVLYTADHHISLGTAYFVAFVAGIAVGGEIPVTALLSARQFGMCHFPKLYAWTFAGNRVASGVGPMLLALLYDLHGDYQWALGMSAALLCVSALLIATLKPGVPCASATRSR